VGKVQNNSLIIDTPDGKRSWGDIEVGDYLFGKNGGRTQVLGKFPHKGWKFYRVEFDDGTATYCGKEHLWAVKGRKQRRRGLDWTVMSLGEIMDIGVMRPNGVSNSKQWEIPTTSPVEYEQQIVFIDPYLYGAFLGDGSKGRNTFSSGTEDWDHWIEVFSKEYDLGVQHYGEGFSLLRFMEVFTEYSDVPTNSLFVHDDYKYNTIDVRLAVLQGLLDTDGNVGGDSRAEFVSISERLVDDVIWLARSLGMTVRKGKEKKPFYYSKDREKIHCQTAYVCYISYMGTDLFRLERKQERLTGNQARYTSKWIKSIEYSHREDGHCVKVDSPDNLYLTNDFIVTHNTSMDAILVLWFQSVFHEDTVIPCTAPSKHQLEDNLWGEIGLWHSRMLPDFRDRIKVMSNKVIVPGLSKCMAVGRTSPPDNSEALAGFHAKNLMIIVDEASGIRDKVFEVAEGTLSTPGARLLMTGNPTRTSGLFYRSHTSEKRYWNCFTLNCEESPHVSKSYCEQREEKYGRDSDVYRVRVLGEFPKGSADALIPLQWVETAIGRDIQDSNSERIAGLDVADGGEDLCGFVIRQGKTITNIRQWSHKDLMQTVGTVVHEYREKKSFDRIHVDGIGVGSGVAARLKELGVPTLSVNVGESSPNSDRYNRLRDDVWWRCRVWFEDKLCGISDKIDKEELDCIVGELSGITFQYLSNGKLKVQGKSAFKEDGVKISDGLKRSPNVGDALCLTLAEGQIPGYIRTDGFGRPVGLHNQNFIQSAKGQSYVW
jgi:hypothetical protein